MSITKISTPKEILLVDTEACPLLLVCDACKSPFMWAEVNGEPGAWCHECNKKYHDKICPPSRAVYVAKSDKWGMSILSRYWWDKYQNAPVEWEFTDDIRRNS